MNTLHPTNALTAPDLPEPIAAYFAADSHRPYSPQALARCFTPQAVVKDEGHTHVGHQAIQAWKARASSKFSYRVEPLALVQLNGQHIVTGHVACDFPGSPVDLRYHFRLERGLIAALEITA